MYISVVIGQRCQNVVAGFVTLEHLDGAAVGVVAVLEQLGEELLVEAVDRVVEGEEHELGDLFWSEVTGNVGAAAVAVRQAAVARVARLGLLLAADNAHSHTRYKGQPVTEIIKLFCHHYYY